MNYNNVNRKLLSIVLIINFSFFVIEIITGIISNSIGLVADSLDMIADAFVYGLSLLVVGTIVFTMLLRGSVRILQLGNN